MRYSKLLTLPYIYIYVCHTTDRPFPWLSLSLSHSLLVCVCMCVMPYGIDSHVMLWWVLQSCCVWGNSHLLLCWAGCSPPHFIHKHVFDCCLSSSQFSNVFCNKRQMEHSEWLYFVLLGLQTQSHGARKSHDSQIEILEMLIQWLWHQLMKVDLQTYDGASCCVYSYADHVVLAVISCHWFLIRATAALQRNSKVIPQNTAAAWWKHSHLVYKLIHNANRQRCVTKKE